MQQFEAWTISKPIYDTSVYSSYWTVWSNRIKKNVFILQLNYSQDWWWKKMQEHWLKQEKYTIFMNDADVSWQLSPGPLYGWSCLVLVSVISHIGSAPLQDHVDFENAQSSAHPWVLYPETYHMYTLHHV